jgi:catabolite regulation protein CreA
MGELTKTKELLKVIRMKDQQDSFVLQHKVTILEDGVEIATSMHTELLTPDIDVDKIDDPDVKKAAIYYWTDEKKAVFLAIKNKNNSKKINPELEKPEPEKIIKK